MMIIWIVMRMLNVLIGSMKPTREASIPPAMPGMTAERQKAPSL